MHVRSTDFLDVVNMMFPTRSAAYRSVDIIDEDADPVKRKAETKTNLIQQAIPSGIASFDATEYAPFYSVDEAPISMTPIDPPYPPEAEKNGIEGQVLLRIYIDEYGKVRKVEVLKSPDESLSLSCIQTVMKTRFKPARIHGKNRAVVVNTPIRFTLK